MSSVYQDDSPKSISSQDHRERSETMPCTTPRRGARTARHDHGSLNILCSLAAPLAVTESCGPRNLAVLLESADPGNRFRCHYAASPAAGDRRETEMILLSIDHEMALSQVRVLRIILSDSSISLIIMAGVR